MSKADAATQFTTLYDTHFNAVYGYLVNRAGRQLAEELASETFLVAWRRLDDVPAAERAWLFGVARNLLRDSRRSAARAASVATELASWVSEQSSSDVADVVVERATVLRALTQLSDNDRELLTLVAWHGLSTSEAARVVGCSRATYFVRLHRARRRLERALATESAYPPVPAASEGNNP